MLPSTWLVLFTIVITRTCSAIPDLNYIRDRQNAAMRNFRERTRESFTHHSRRASSVKNITFSNPRASEFYVDGTKIPEVNWDVGPSWAGLLPISNAPDESRKLFFWFFPPGPQGSLDDLVFWTNGGPGCSALEGLLQENGPFSWAWGQAKPTVNEYSWTNLSSVIWIEQPVGTGYTQGQASIKNEDDLAAQLVGFLNQFLSIFSELKGKNFYIAGESYAGMYLPYIANHIYQNPGALDLKLKGVWMADPVLGRDVLQNQVPTVDFVRRFEHVFAFNSSFMAQLDQISDQCGYKGYASKYLQYPPQGLLPIPSGNDKNECDVWGRVFEAALRINPAFNIYRIFDTYPILWDVLGFPGSFPDVQTTPVYFDRPDIKQLLHVPTNKRWSVCTYTPVFDGPDRSPPPALNGVLSNAIEKSERSVIIHGLGDFILIAEGTRIVIQNTTWGGKQGFQEPIKEESFILNGVGSMGVSHTERGLSYVEVVLCGHMVPQFSPVAAFRTMEYLLGFKPTISD